MFWVWSIFRFLQDRNVLTECRLWSKDALLRIPLLVTTKAVNSYIWWRVYLDFELKTKVRTCCILMMAVKKERDAESLLSRFGSKISLRLSLSSAVNSGVCSVSSETSKVLVGKLSHLSLWCESRQEKPAFHLLKDVKQWQYKVLVLMWLLRWLPVCKVI